MHNQLRAVLDHLVVDGVWLLGWNPPSTTDFTYNWACFLGTDNRWTDKQHIAESIQVEVGGSTEVIVTSVPCSGMTSADPPTFDRQQPLSNSLSGGTRLKFNLDTRQSIRIRFEPVNSDVATRIQLDGYNWSGRQYSFAGPWNKAQYTRNPRLAHNDASLNPLHGTGINWNGWNEQDVNPVQPNTSYDVQLQNATGGNLGGIITVTTTNV